MQVGRAWAVVGVSLYKPVFPGLAGLDLTASKDSLGFYICSKDNFKCLVFFTCPRVNSCSANLNPFPIQSWLQCSPQKPPCLICLLGVFFELICSYTCVGGVGFKVVFNGYLFL